MMRRNPMTASLILASVLLMTTGTKAFADPTPLKPVRQLTLPNSLPLTEYRLVNGLTLYVIENHAAPVFTYQTWFDVGSKDEELDPEIHATGLAHLFEHMMFRGTHQIGDGQFDAILAENGVHDENASTWVDRTNYYESLPKDKLQLVMELESDRMSNLAIDDKLLQTEKNAVIGEYNMGLDDPDTVAQDLLYNTAYTVHPYKYSTIGTEQEIQSFTLKQANYFYKKYYSPSNATLLIVGDVVPSTVAALAQTYYGPIPGVPVQHAIAPVEPQQTEERQAQFRHAQLQQTRVLFGHHIPGVYDEDFPALWVLLSALTYGHGSLLELAWVNAGIAVTVHGEINQFKDPGLFIISADLQPGKTAQDAESALDQVLNSIISNGADGIIDRARNQLLLSIHRQMEGNEGLASFLGEFIPTVDDPVYGFTLISQIQAVKPADLVRVAKAYLGPSNRTVVVGNP